MPILRKSSGTTGNQPTKVLTPHHLANFEQWDLEQVWIRRTCLFIFRDAERSLSSDVIEYALQSFSTHFSRLFWNGVRLLTALPCGELADDIPKQSWMLVPILNEISEWSIRSLVQLTCWREEGRKGAVVQVWIMRHYHCLDHRQSSLLTRNAYVISALD